ncbi:MAG TPA: PAS domain-containing sensor histidine kinase [Actinomycetota bacterium]|nr:PAS domain-containing sensor histidine kinase [Actinomycetota bacterium]
MTSETEDAAFIRDRLAAIVRSADDAIFSKDLNGIITSWNRGAERLYGYTEAEIVGRSISIIIPPDRSGEEKLILDRIIRGLGVDHYETCRMRRDGEIVDVSITASPIHDASDQIVGASVIARDISAEKMTRRLSDRLAAVVEGSDDAIYSKDVDAVVDSWNQGAERLYGYTPEEAIGQHVSFIVPPDRKGEETVILQRILAGERVDHFETERMTKSGNRVEVSITVSPVRDGSRIVGASVVARDIGDRRRLEVLERHLDRSEFIARAAHELRSPVTTLVAFARLIADHPDLPRADLMDACGAIARQGEAITGLLKDLLDLSYVESGRYQIDLKPVPMNEVVARALESAPPPRGKEIVVDVSEDAVVVGDAARLGQVVVNLVENAYKYGGDRITIVIKKSATNVVMEVSDDGTGIPDEIQETLFQPFIRAHKHLPGSGLGLAIASRLVEAHGGVIEAAPMSEGARFVVTLPMAKAPALDQH